MLAIDIGEDVSVTKSFARGSSALYLVDASGGTYMSYNINGYVPLNYVIKPNGTVYNGTVGFDESTIESWINASIVAVEENNAAKVETPKLVFSANPFKAKTVISIRGVGTVGTLQIHDLTGKLVKSFSITPNSAVTWDRTDNNDMHMPAGMYFCSLNAGKVSLTKKLIVLE